MKKNMLQTLAAGLIFVMLLSSFVCAVDPEPPIQSEKTFYEQLNYNMWIDSGALLITLKPFTYSGNSQDYYPGVATFPEINATVGGVDFPLEEYHTYYEYLDTLPAGTVITGLQLYVQLKPRPGNNGCLLTETIAAVKALQPRAEQDIESVAFFPMTRIWLPEYPPLTDEIPWYVEGENYVLAQALMNGVSENKGFIHFDGKGTCTRAMAARILFNMDGMPEVTGSSPFADVLEGSWYDEATAWGHESGIVQGVDASHFAPDRLLTREEFVTMMYRYVKYQTAAGDDSNNTNESVLSAYTDAEEISAFAKEAMIWAVDNGVLKGTSATTLSPKHTITRDETATAVMRLHILVQSASNI